MACLVDCVAALWTWHEPEHPHRSSRTTGGAAVFFEFVHYKPKKRKKSCRCWALLEMDEVPPSGGSALVLELYQKPKDPTRKRINLFTVKELYLHVHLTRTTHQQQQHGDEEKESSGRS